MVVKQGLPVQFKVEPVIPQELEKKESSICGAGKALDPCVLCIITDQSGLRLLVSSNPHPPL